MDESKARILEHMNNHHKGELVGLCAKYGGVNVEDATITDLNEDGMIIFAGGKDINVPFKSRVVDHDYKRAIIDVCADMVASAPGDGVRAEMEGFIGRFNSVVMATLSEDNEVFSSYAPLMRYGGEFYIYISEASDHFRNIKSNPENIDVMFIEDESSASSLLARVRLRRRAKASFIERGELFDSVFDSFVDRVGGTGGVSQVRKMTDFHMVKLEFGAGRFVKGFGQAYDVLPGGDIISLSGNGMPHRIN